MKKFILISVLGLAGALALPAQQGRGGPPLAWNDADKDGICDVTGQKVGQNPGQGRRMGPGRGMAGAWGRGWGRGRAMVGRGVGGAWTGRGRGMGPCGRGLGWSRPGAPATNVAPQNQPQAQPQSQSQPNNSDSK